MTDTLSIDKVIDLADSVAKRVASEYPGIDSEDIAQEALAGYLDDGVETDNPAYAYAVLMRHATAYAAKERYDYVIATSSYVYRPDEVKALLKEVFFQESSHDVPTQKDDPISAEIGRGVVYVSVLDIGIAWRKLSKGHSDTLFKKYRDREAVHPETLSRAVEALTRYMNGYVNRADEDHERPGSRRAMSNSEAQFMTRGQW